MSRIRSYFYGSSSLELSPYATSIGFNEIAVRRIGENQKAPDSALPIGGERKIDESQLLKIETGPVLLHSVLFVSNAELSFNATDNDERVLTEINIRGLVRLSTFDGQ